MLPPVDILIAPPSAVLVGKWLVESVELAFVVDTAGDEVDAGNPSAFAVLASLPIEVVNVDWL